MPETPVPSYRLSRMGSGACLLDAAGPAFDDDIQRRVWAMARDALAIAGVLECVPGMNNLLLVFDPLRIDTPALEQAVRAAWTRAAPRAVAGASVEIPVVYGGPGGEDLAGLAEHAGLAVDEVIRRHADARYTVAAIGAMPGFPYLSGLDPALAWGRRASPRLTVAEGSVMIGGGQAGIMPCTAPSGWHVIGRTDIRLFDPTAADPVLLKPGDSLRFTVAGVEA